MAYWVYIMQSESTGQYYVGQTKHLKDRVARHNSGRTGSIRGLDPWRLRYQEQFATRQAAVSRERAMKARKSRTYLEGLCMLPIVKNRSFLDRQPARTRGANAGMVITAWRAAPFVPPPPPTACSSLRQS
jgi:putative endonuclease